tara:strand:+ start:434 stop:1885 length:1452 start_codon:yes stop_codon:yes gene_type:complete
MPINSFLYPAPSTPSFRYDVANSCRFDGSSAYMHKTPSSEGNKQTFTFSTWVKRSLLGVTTAVDQHLISAGSGNLQLYIFFLANSGSGADSSNTDCLNVYATDSAGNIEMALRTSALYRDVSSWMHVCVAIDTTQGTDTNRVKIYVNGTQITSFSLATYPAQNENLAICDDVIHEIARRPAGTTKYFNGYLAETVLIDGQQLAPTSFGEFDSDSPNIWKPIDVSGLTAGTNGFYLDYEDSSNLGNDVFGGTDLTEVNLAATDQSTDTCTNNFATLNPLAGKTAITFSEGNLKAVFAAQSSRDICQSGFGVSNGKWYWEVKGNNSYGRAGGITAKGHDTESNNVGGSSFSYGYYGDNGTIYNNNSNSGLPTYATYASNTIGVYLDLDNNKLYFSKDGSLQSATGISITDPASLGDNFYFPAVSNGESGQGPTFEFNFGSPAYSISSGNTDDNNYGNFEYSPNITGDGSAKSFYALNSRNLAEFG